MVVYINSSDNTLKSAFLLMWKIAKDVQMGPFCSWVWAEQSLSAFLASVQPAGQLLCPWAGHSWSFVCLTSPAAGMGGIPASWPRNHMGTCGELCEPLLSHFHLAEQSQQTSPAPKHQFCDKNHGNKLKFVLLPAVQLSGCKKMYFHHSFVLLFYNKDVFWSPLIWIACTSGMRSPENYYLALKLKGK